MVRELPLNPFWESLGATLKTERDWKIPALFKDFLSEHTAVRKGVGLIDCSFRGKIEVTGKDRASFLHSVLTNDIKNLGLGAGCYSALLSAAGKILADMNVAIFANSIFLDTEMGMEKKLLELLNKLLVTEDVALSDVTEQFVLIALEGPRAEALAQTLFPGPFPELKEFHHANAHMGEANVTLIHRNQTGENGYQLLIPKGTETDVVERTLLVGKLYGLRPVGFGTSEILRIEAGVPRYGIDMDENLTLPETGLEGIAASETKGCYPGQEVVARTKTYGGPNRKIVGLGFEKGKLPGYGDKITSNGKEIGWVTSACISPMASKGAALGVVAKGFFENSVAVKIKSSAGEIEAVTGPLPLTTDARVGIRGQGF